MSDSLYQRIATLEAEGRPAVIVSVVRASGSTPRAPGARMLVMPDGRIEGTIGGGRIEQQAIEEALKALTDGRPRYIEHQLTQELGMCCGGSVALYFEVLTPKPVLILYGAGHVGTALARMAAYAGFVVHVADEREELLKEERFAEARRLYTDLDDVALPFSERSYVMVTTHDHALDQRLVEKVLQLPHAWVGMIGSRRKAELARQRLATKGFGAEQIARLRSPVGMAIGAETPEEIAVSILSELVAHRHGVLFVGEHGPVLSLETKSRS